MSIIYKFLAGHRTKELLLRSWSRIRRTGRPRDACSQLRKRSVPVQSRVELFCIHQASSKALPAWPYVLTLPSWSMHKLKLPDRCFCFAIHNGMRWLLFVCTSFTSGTVWRIYMRAHCCQILLFHLHEAKSFSMRRGCKPACHMNAHRPLQDDEAQLFWSRYECTTRCGSM
jgi:hypothetical protein